MSTQHTPGPWTVKKAGFQSGVITAPTRSLGIAEVFGGGEPDSANALLISAAPDLLAAAKELAELLRYDGRGHVRHPLKTNRPKPRKGSGRPAPAEEASRHESK